MPIEVLTSADGVNLVDTPDSHVYTIDGKRIPGCTTIIANAGYCDYSMVPEQVMKHKSAFGTLLHDYCLWWDQKDLELEEMKKWPAYYSRILGWTQFVEDFELEFSLMEQPLAIKVNGMVFGVKPDRLGIGKFGDQRKICTIEIKSTHSIERAAELQTAGQALALKDEDPLPARVICQLLETPNQAGKNYNYKRCADNLDERIFLSCLAIETDKRNHGILK
jgi:hypothetical protein